jgi:hypothetical protein
MEASEDADVEQLAIFAIAKLGKLLAFYDIGGIGTETDRRPILRAVTA